MRLRLLTILFLLTGVLTANAQKLSDADSAKFAKYEVKLKKFSHYSMNFPFEQGRKDYSDSLKKLLPQVLEEPNSFYYPFDSMKTVFRLITEDKKLRIFTWAVIDNSGTHTYHGFIQYNQNKFKEELDKTVIELKSNAPEENLLFEELGPNNWYGALYYQAKKIRYKRKEYYVMLGYNGHDTSMNIKVLDVMHFGDDNELRFGADLFFMGKDYKKAKAEYKQAIKEQKKYDADPIRQSNAEQKVVEPLFNKRVLFYFADDATMTLRFEHVRRSFLGINANLWGKSLCIIWDSLDPIKGASIGNYGMYYPGGTYDYLKYKKGVFYFNELFFSNEKIE